MKKLAVKVVTLSLVFALMCACTAGASAGFWDAKGNSWERWGESVGDFWENWGENVGDEAEKSAEELADAIESAVDAAGEQEENVDVPDFVSSIGTAVKSFLGGMSKWFKK